MNKKKLTSFFLNYWEKSYDLSQFSFLEKLLFYFLILLEKIYIFFFHIILYFKQLFFKPYLCKPKIISVGNISVGGTGKSVFVSFLVQRLKSKSCAIILRGYKSKVERLKKSFLLMPEKFKNLDTNFFGDEAIMLCRNTHISVAVGSNRLKSYLLLEEKFKNLDFIILDDAYQNFKLKKDLEILLLDATKPFENGHCLPAGRLREKDCTRADIIVLTHADSVNFNQLRLLKEKLSLSINKENIFLGDHNFSGIYFNDKLEVEKKYFVSKKVLAFAGIGSFDSFKKNIKALQVGSCFYKEFPDHHSYTKTDFDGILNYLNNKKVDVIITTQKDWVKLEAFVKNKFELPIYTLRIDFKFLKKEEENLFFDKINKM